MADIYFYQGDTDEDDGGYSDSSITTPSQDDGLSPVEKLEKYADSENIFNRQMVARTVLETLRQVLEDKEDSLAEDVVRVFNVVELLARDTEPSVRAELMEQVPHIAMFCQEQEAQTSLTGVVPTHLLPLVVKFLTDTNSQVRKTSQAALLVLLEQGLVDTQDVVVQACPVLIQLTEADSVDDYRTEAVALIAKMAPLIGKENAEKIFLERFATLCTDPLFHVRKVCAANFGDFSGVVGAEATEKVLLPKFFYLCEDGVWGVRKACADVFMPVSCVCSPAVRQSELSPLFINLLKDQSRWVRMAAFQALGPFISTFADPLITALLQNQNGEIVITDPDQLAERLAKVVAVANEVAARDQLENKDKDDDEVMMDLSSDSKDVTENKDDIEQSFEEKRAKTYEDSTEYCSFLYWREPVSDIFIEDIDILEDRDVIESNVEEPQESVLSTVIHEATIEEVKNELSTLDTESSTDEDNVEDKSKEDKVKDNDDMILEAHISDTLDNDQDKSNNESSSPAVVDWENWSKNSNSQSPLFSEENSSEDSETSKPTYAQALASGSESGRWTALCETSPMSSSQETELQDLALPRGPPQTKQSIVPQLLIDHYVSMIDPSRAQTVDNDIARHCAFSLPAVALTLGRANWPLIRETYETLANDMQWKVRRTVASSIHELGVILGEEIAAEDLVPIFDGFIKDLDEVRIGALKHLANFLSLLSVETRNAYLPRLEEFLKMDNERNWRFRLELTEQVGAMLSLFTPGDIREYLAPMATHLVQDKVSAVRVSATSVLSTMLAQLHSLNHPILASSLASNIVEVLGRSPHWAKRQTYAVLCGELIKDSSEEDSQGYSPAYFSTELLPHLLDLTWDKVPNVRLAVARVVARLPAKYQASCIDLVEAATAQLKEDKDVDVRTVMNPDLQQIEVKTEVTEVTEPQQ